MLQKTIVGVQWAEKIHFIPYSDAHLCCWTVSQAWKYLFVYLTVLAQLFWVCRVLVLQIVSVVSKIDKHQLFHVYCFSICSFQNQKVNTLLATQLGFKMISPLWEWVGFVFFQLVGCGFCFFVGFFLALERQVANLTLNLTLNLLEDDGKWFVLCSNTYGWLIPTFRNLTYSYEFDMLTVLIWYYN